MPLEAKDFAPFEKVLGYEFQNKDLLKQALTHKSFINEFARQSKQNDNEKLEFLGDAVLDLAMSEVLMAKYSQDEEGQLSKKRASLVNEDALFDIAKKLEVHDVLQMGRGEKRSGGALKPRLLACAVEALLGAIFIESGYSKARDVIAQLFQEKLENLKEDLDFEKDFKTRLQEICQQKFNQLPSYEITHEVGPAHQKFFVSEIYLAGKWLARGQGPSKKMAEQVAAKIALEVL
jgi:ribonuclease-3